AAVNRALAARVAGDARHAPYPPFGDRVRTQQQLRLLPVRVGSTARYVYGAAAGRTRHRARCLARSGAGGDAGRDAGAAIPAAGVGRAIQALLSSRSAAEGLGVKI